MGILVGIEGKSIGLYHLKLLSSREEWRKQNEVKQEEKETIDKDQKRIS